LSMGLNDVDEPISDSNWETHLNQVFPL
jgi:hypothetical protein